MGEVLKFTPNSEQFSGQSKEKKQMLLGLNPGIFERMLDAVPELVRNLNRLDIDPYGVKEDRYLKELREATMGELIDNVNKSRPSDWRENPLYYINLAQELLEREAH